MNRYSGGPGRPKGEVVSNVCRRNRAGDRGSRIARHPGMRLVTGILALTLFASFARAEDTRTTEPAESAASAGSAADVIYRKVPLRVVRIMAQSHQALLFDRSRATHVLAEVGSKIDGYTVEAIDDDDVTLRLEGKQIVLAAPPRGG